MIWQLIAHGWGDYILQSSWMAANKMKRSWPCLVHATIYAACFIPLGASWKALLVIGGTHFILDRFPSLVRLVAWLKNGLSPVDWYVPLAWCKLTGYYDPEVVPSHDPKLAPPDEGRSLWERFSIWLNNTYIASDECPRRFTERELKLYNRVNSHAVQPIWIRRWLFIITDNVLHLTINAAALYYL